MDISKLNLRPISEDKVVSIFLKGELKSKRFSKDIKDTIKELNTNISLIQNPNLNNAEENRLRLNIIDKTRGYTSRTKLFEDFPKDVKWYRTEVSKEFLLNEVMYIDYDYWVGLTNGSRLPKDAVEKIQKNEQVFNVSYDNLLEASEYFKKNKSFDEIIIVSDKKKFVVLEGHLRLTVYALNKEILPKENTVIIGISERMSEWSNF
ncbi:MAG TPA: hypothetical protein PKI16_02510 [Candidatus Dojkabacteria bacterium]|nr:hypothetical protein [Candidatus Dojkabacteria bacterium]